MFLDNPYYPIWYLKELVIAQTFGFRVMPRTPPPPPYVWDAYNTEYKAIALVSFSIMDLVDTCANYAKFINKYLMYSLIDGSHIHL